MILFKACRKCGGDMRSSSDMYGEYFQCAQCGNLIDLPERALVTAEAARAAA